MPRVVVLYCSGRGCGTVIRPIAGRNFPHASAKTLIAIVQRAGHFRRVHPARRRDDHHVRRRATLHEGHAQRPQIALELWLGLVGHQHKAGPRRPTRPAGGTRGSGRCRPPGRRTSRTRTGSGRAAAASNISGWPAQWLAQTYSTFSSRRTASRGALSAGSLSQYGDWKAARGSIDEDAHPVHRERDGCGEHRHGAGATRQSERTEGAEDDHGQAAPERRGVAAGGVEAVRVERGPAEAAEDEDRRDQHEQDQDGVERRQARKRDSRISCHASERCR